ncbi:M28 family peptidase [Algoriphagus sp. CAU 1675]|uniref:M28 family peptidase n=1 Tax=Algoriphagus sp. CAU 1675 TaxID=3032597 RepID=UPI0023DBDD42|nr:M28 family peptidase [Algoriphagus sp. CAU 1675]MDF2156535.1 M28 family peptidase [Algoriphagus sp. CAU 1675]
MHPSKKVLLIGLLIIYFFSSHAQSIRTSNLIKHLNYLASDELGGRKTGTEGNAMARTYILEEFEKIGLETHYLDMQQAFTFQNRREQKEYTGINVVAFVPGTETKKLIVLTAHYDHVGIRAKNTEGDSIYNGADDNASGTAALLELAKYFSENPPRHSMIFAALDAEEMGLQGARALLRDFPFDLEQIEVNVNMDMISRSDKGELYASGTYHHPQLKSILENASSGQKPTLLFGHDLPDTGADDWSYSSDHGAFLEKGIPFVYFGVEDHEDYHQPSDEYHAIDSEFFVDAMNLILKCVLELDEQLINP